MTPKKLSMQEFLQNSYLAGNNAAYIEQLYEDYLTGQTVSPQWQQYFQQTSNGSGLREVKHRALQAELKILAQQQAGVSSTVIEQLETKQQAVDQLIQAFRQFGHLHAKLDPLDLMTRPVDHRLQLAHYRLSDADLNTTFNTNGVLKQSHASLKTIYQALQKIYCQTIGVEYGAVLNEDERNWLIEQTERHLHDHQFNEQEKQALLKQLIAADILEKYLDTKHKGQKRFSIEGGDSLIPLLNTVISDARQANVEELVIGMAHRGRLNMLVNVLGQSAAETDAQFKGTADLGDTSGDVKYHLGYSQNVMTEHGEVHLSLACNPSHLEFIAPVVMGSVRARQERQATQDINQAIPIIIHGDAAVSGQGVVMETLSMSQTRAHQVGGSIHVIVNNQVGFTMSNLADARSSLYCSDVVKMIEAPVWHVNADDVESVVRVAKLALAYRQRFHKDVFIDLVCYRRHGHQEVDEPTATQPLMYQAIKAHPVTQKIYADSLIAQSICSAEQVKQWITDYRQKLNRGERVVAIATHDRLHRTAADWSPYLHQDWTAPARTGVSASVLKKLGQTICEYPKQFKLQRQVDMMIQARQRMQTGEQALDWGYAETLAYASLLNEGYGVRLVGEDSRRGTFFHRQSTLFDQQTGEEFTPLKKIAKKSAQFAIYDSLLSETGAMGFEYGYASANPNTLVLWEAQYGDFANVAQVIIDQFISSGWQKWQRLCGLVLLLPHGYEGSGPEHSSARLERYLQLTAQHNIQVCMPSTPAQIFHLLRRQMIRPFRSPLIVVTPKSFLRHKLATSSLQQLAQANFELVIPESEALSAKKIRRVVLCSGKVYYDLLEHRLANKIQDIAIIRIEQLYPFPYDALKQALADYVTVEDIVWCQEEPKNQGAWFCTRHRIMRCLADKQQLRLISRDASAAPAVGYASLHKKQQEELIENVFAK